MKTFLLVISLFTFTNLLNAQKTYHFEFENGEKRTVTINYDDPQKMSKWEASINLFGFSVIREGALIFQLKLLHRVNPKLIIESNLISPYGKKMDGNLHESLKNNSLYQQTLLFNTMGHYIISESHKSKLLKTAVDWGYPDDKTTIIYSANIPRVISKAISADGGFSYYQIPINLELSNSYYIPMAKYLSLNLGISYMKSQSYKMTSNGISRSYRRSSRAYLYLTNAFLKKNNVYKDSEITSNSDYEKPKFISIGWRIGYEIMLGIKNTDKGISLGVEMGGLPHMTTKYVSSGAAVSASSILLLKFGFTLGTKIEE